MLYLADYFAVISTKIECKEGDSNSTVRPAVSLRVPSEDNPDHPFPEGIELFALPNGWNIESKWRQPLFHTTQCTKLDGSPYYAAFFTFFTNSGDDKFEPISLILIARHIHIRQLKNALILCYDKHILGNDGLERVVAKILAQPIPFPESRSMVRYSLGCGDFQAIQAARSSEIPVTESSIAKLLSWIGPTNLMNLVLLLLTDNKVAMFGRSFSALSEASRALTALIYPFKYSFPHIPILPASMLDMLMSPVPFLVGVHADRWEERLGENPDVIGCDLDGSKIILPDHIQIPKLPEQLEKELIHRLTLVSQPGLATADLAFSPSKQSPSPPIILDKEVRAIFLLFLVRILHSYRSAIQFSRIHPIIQTKLQKDIFIQPSDHKRFKEELSNSQAFQIFIQERGPPYRQTDLFDKLIEQYIDSAEYDVESYELSNEVRILRDDFLLNEMPNWAKTRDLDQCLPVERVIETLSGNLAAIQAPHFPHLSEASILVFKDEESNKVVSERFQPQAPTPMRIQTAEEQIIMPPSDTNAKRHLAVLHDFMISIKDENIQELKKRFSAVCRAMKSRLVRKELCVCLMSWNSQSESESAFFLSNLQFEYIVRLAESALTNSTGSSDQCNVAAAMIPVSSQLYRKLGTKKQFLYTQIQDHAVWSNYNFWLDHFFIENQIRLATHYRADLARAQSDRYSNITILRVSGEQLADWQNKTENQRAAIGDEEEGIVFSQIIELVYQVIPLLVPFNPQKIGALHRHMRANQTNGHDGGSSIFAGSAMESDTDEDEGFAERDGGSLQIVHKFIERIQDKLTIECKINNTHSTQLQMLAQSTIHQFADEYLEIQRAFKALPAIRKPIDHAPKMLTNEIVKRQIAAFLLTDNREYGLYQFEADRNSSILEAKESLLPAEGTLFLTNYRLIFHGTSMEHERNMMIRAMPIASIMKVKSFTSQLSEVSEASNYNLQVRSATCEFLHVVFNIEVGDDERDQFNAALNTHRFPANQSPLDVFAISQTSGKTINKNIQFKPKHNTFQQGIKGMTMGLTKGVRTGGLRPRSADSPRSLPAIAEQVTKTLSNKNTLEKFTIRACRNNDFSRTGLLQPATSNYRSSKVNKLMLACKTYPAISVQPVVITDDVLRSVIKCFKKQRFPTIVWKHPRGAVLARSESIIPGIAGHLFRRRKVTVGEEGEMSQLRNPTRDFEIWLQAIVKTSTRNRSTSVLQKSSNAMYMSNVSLASAKLGSNMNINNSSGFIRGAPSIATMSNTIRDSAREIKSSTLNRFKSGNRDSMIFDGNSSYSSGNSSKVSTMNMNVSNNKYRAKLVILVEKSVAKKARPDPDSEVELLATCLASADQIRDAFKDMVKNFCAQVKTNISLTECSRWCSYVNDVLEAASLVSELMVHESVSVLIALESGWDMASVLSALSQIVTDSHYRTFDGFRTLIEREFLSFGHRFSTHSIHHDSQTPSPIFMLFLDCCNQLLTQNPSLFEFTTFYLEAMAYHVYSGRFSTFLLDSDYERIEAGILFDMDQRHCFWSYIQRAIAPDSLTHEVNYKLVNAAFYADSRDVILPNTNLNCFTIFNLFTLNSIADTTCYDNLCNEVSIDIDEEPQMSRKIVMAGYENLFDVQRPHFPTETTAAGHVVSTACSFEKRDTRMKMHSQSVTQMVNYSRALKGDRDANSLIVEMDKVRNLEDEVRQAKTNTIHDGYMYKQGNNYLKRWKHSFFVIEDKKSLVQYDEHNGRRTFAKSIELSEIIGVKQTRLDPRNVPKYVDPSATISVQLRTRKYIFIADSPSAARKWVDILTDCIA